MLNAANKGINDNEIINTMYLLNEYEMDVAVSFVLGLPGETKASLHKTLQHLEQISWMNNVIENHASVMIPLPGSRIWKEIMGRTSLRKKYGGKDLINLVEFQIDYLNNFTVCGASVVFDYYLKIDSFFTSAGPFYCDKDNSFFKLIHFKENVFETI
jgi:radical SAM superfamily enzyme YgiQ (UPF0313 family)